MGTTGKPDNLDLQLRRTNAIEEEESHLSDWAQAATELGYLKRLCRRKARLFH